jgi:trimeric autotransporter adhesin
MLAKRLAWLSLACALGCADDDAGRFGADGTELAEFRVEPGDSLRLSSHAVTLSVNERLDLTVSRQDEGAARDLTAVAEWSSDDPTIAWVHNGAITGVLPGVTQVSASYAGRTDSVDVAVTTRGLEAIELHASLRELPKGVSATLRAVGTFYQGARRDISGLVRWESSDTDVAAIDGSSVRAVGLGKATIEGALNDITASLEISVTDARLLDLQLEKPAENLLVGERLQLRALGSFSDEQTSDVTELATWTTDDGNLARIDEHGVVSARNPGAVVFWARFLGHAAQTSVAIRGVE